MIPRLDFPAGEKRNGDREIIRGWRADGEPVTDRRNGKVNKHGFFAENGRIMENRHPETGGELNLPRIASFLDDGPPFRPVSEPTVGWGAARSNRVGAPIISGRIITTFRIGSARIPDRFRRGRGSFDFFRRMEWTTIEPGDPAKRRGTVYRKGGAPTNAGSIRTKSAKINVAEAGGKGENGIMRPTADRRTDPCENRPAGRSFLPQRITIEIEKTMAPSNIPSFMRRMIPDVDLAQPFARPGRRSGEGSVRIRVGGDQQKP